MIFFFTFGSHEFLFTVSSCPNGFKAQHAMFLSSLLNLFFSYIPQHKAKIWFFKRRENKVLIFGPPQTLIYFSVVIFHAFGFKKEKWWGRRSNKNEGVWKEPTCRAPKPPGENQRNRPGVTFCMNHVVFAFCMNQPLWFMLFLPHVGPPFSFHQWAHWDHVA